MAAIANSLRSRREIERLGEFPCGPDGTARLLAVECDFHQSIGFQQVDQYSPSRHWIVEVMKHPDRLDYRKTSIQMAELEDVGLSVGNVRNSEPFRHPCGVGQTCQA